MNMSEKKNSHEALSCPIPLGSSSTITLAHGGGGKLSHQLVERVFRPAFDNSDLETKHDGAVVDGSSGKLALTTDSYVVRPLIFPGGDIGSLAVNGTVNDLAMCGALPLYLTAGFILEEGLPMETLWTVVQTMKKAADLAGIKIVTGDTKVVDKGKGDGIFINTTGVGLIKHGLKIHPQSIQPGDVVLLSGDIGRHGMAIMAAREGFGLQEQIKSDCASLSHLVQNLINDHIEIHCMRDLTRGGLATSLIEIAQDSGFSIEVAEENVEVSESVKGACEILGLDPFYVANEGRFIVIVKEEDAERVLKVLQKDGLANQSRLIGTVKKEDGKTVTLRTKIGTYRILDMLSGEQLPRIC